MILIINCLFDYVNVYLTLSVFSRNDRMRIFTIFIEKWHITRNSRIGFLLAGAVQAFTNRLNSCTMLHMKKKCVFLMFLGAVLFFSCERSDEPASHEEPVVFELLADDHEQASAVAKLPGHAFRVNSFFYNLDGEDTGDETAIVRWVRGDISLGEPLQLGDVRRMTFHGQVGTRDHGQIFDFRPATRQNGETGFVLSGQVALGSGVAVVTDERANLFTGPRPVDITGTVLSRGTVVVYDPAAESGGFLSVRGFDLAREASVLASASHVRSADLSRADSDVQAAILLQTALALPAAQAARRQALLEMALEMYWDSVFFEDIFKTLHPVVAEVLPEEIGIPEEEAAPFWHEEEGEAEEYAY